VVYAQEDVVEEKGIGEEFRVVVVGSEEARIRDDRD
jgi:hypothetical protein